MADKKRKVTLAYPWTDQGGKRHKPDSTVEVDDLTARDLIRAGKARPAGEAPKATSSTTEKKGA